MITIRKGVLKDCKELVELAKIPELKTPSGYYPSFEWFQAIIKEKQILVVAEENKKIVGFNMGERIAGDWAISHLIMVNPAYRNKGVGSMLVKAFEDECIRRKFGGVVLYAYANNKNTVDFFKKKKYNEGSPVIEFNKHLGKRLGHK